MTSAWMLDSHPRIRSPRWGAVRVSLVVVLLALTVVSARGQSLWPRPYQTNQVAVEWVVPTFDDGDVRPVTSAAFLNVSYALTRRVTVVGELPAAYYMATAGDSTITTSALGNPYIGVGLSPTSLPFLLELGVRVPIGPDNRAAFAGAVADVGRSNAFRHGERSASAFANWRWPLATRTSLRLRGGAVLGQHADSTGQDQWDTRLRYGAQLWREGDPLLVGLTAGGRADLSASGALTHQIAASVMLDLHPVQPGLLVGMWLDGEVQDVASFFFGITISSSHLQ